MLLKCRFMHKNFTFWLFWIKIPHYFKRLKKLIMSSAVDPDPDPLIQPFLAGSGSTEPGDMFLMNSWWNLRAFRLLNFENPSRGSKVRDFLSWGPIFGQKINFLADMTMLLLSLMMESTKNLLFWPKVANFDGL